MMWKELQKNRLKKASSAFKYSKPVSGKPFSGVFVQCELQFEIATLVLCVEKGGGA